LPCFVIAIAFLVMHRSGHAESVRPHLLRCRVH
jgi:hypothetical protein